VAEVLFVYISAPDPLLSRILLYPPKKLNRVKDVNYDKETGIIKDIPPLCYIKQTQHFTLKNIDKRVSTLKSLAPKKLQGTHKNKVLTKKYVDSDEEN